MSIIQRPSETALFLRLVSVLTAFHTLSLQYFPLYLYHGAFSVASSQIHKLRAWKISQWVLKFNLPQERSSCYRDI